MAEEHQRRVPRLVHASLAVATVGLAFILGLVALGTLYDVEDASLVVRSIGFATLVAWTATTLGFAYRAWRAFSKEPSGATAGEKDKPTHAEDPDREEPLRDRAAWIATVSALGAAVLLTLAVIGAILFEGKGNPDAALAVVGISPAGQVAVAQQCGGATLPQLTAEIDESSLDEQELRMRPVGSCRGADEVVVPQREIASISLLDDGAFDAGPQIGGVGIDWSVPARLRAGDPEDDDALTPRRWPVILEVSDPEHPTCEGAAYEWSISRSDSNGALRLVASRVTQEPGCTFSVELPGEDTYRVDLVVTSAGGSVATGSAEVVVQDWLIVALGDSVASGEGHPAKQSPHWRGAEERCHRSVEAWPRRAALMLETADERTSVTFVHLACTGARIRRTDDHVPGQVLLAGESAAIPSRSQFGQAERLLRRTPREIDAVVVSIGANDIRFSEIVITCLLKPKCNERYDDELPQRLADLEESYDGLAGAFRSSPALRNAPVYLTEYFDPIHDENGKPCRIGIPWIRRAQITKEEAEWAFLQVLQPLIETGRTAADNQGWTYVDGIADEFATHGYCARDSWVVGIAEAARRTPGFLGLLNLRRVVRSMRQFPFHPGTDGHRAYAELVEEALRNEFYDRDGEPRPPRLPTTTP
jgi:GDSL-like Lipase/Acylhydrolase family